MTLFSMRNWQQCRANATIHNWHVKEFLLITQCDLHNAIQDCFNLLQVSSYSFQTHSYLTVNRVTLYNALIIGFALSAVKPRRSYYQYKID